MLKQINLKSLSTETERARETWCLKDLCTKIFTTFKLAYNFTQTHSYCQNESFPICPTSVNLQFFLPIHPLSPSRPLALSLSLSYRLEVSSTLSQGRICLRPTLLMPGWLSGSDSSVPAGVHQTFSASDHQSPWWIALKCALCPQRLLSITESVTQRQRREIEGWLEEG